jgi:hypothetical protein
LRLPPEKLVWAQADQARVHRLPGRVAVRELDTRAGGEGWRNLYTWWQQTQEAQLRAHQVKRAQVAVRGYKSDP